MVVEFKETENLNEFAWEILHQDLELTWASPQRCCGPEPKSAAKNCATHLLLLKKRQLAKFDFERQMIQAIQKMEIQVIVKSVPLLWLQALAPRTIESHWVVGHVNQVKLVKFAESLMLLGTGTCDLFRVQCSRDRAHGPCMPHVWGKHPPRRGLCHDSIIFTPRNDFFWIQRILFFYATERIDHIFWPHKQWPNLVRSYQPLSTTETLPSPLSSHGNHPRFGPFFHLACCHPAWTLNIRNHWL